MIPVSLERALILLLWLFSVLLPLMGILLRNYPVQQPVLQSRSIEWLALPTGPDVLLEPARILPSLNGLLEGSASAPKPGVDEQPEEPPAPDTDHRHGPQFRIRLFGIVMEGQIPVYCFLDTEKNRWFRLRAGQSDPVSRIGLDVDDADGTLCIQDLDNGAQFRMKPENWKISLSEIEEQDGESH